MAVAPLEERVAHIIEAIDHLDRMWVGKPFTDFVADPILIAATERFLERICEAAKHIPDDRKAAYPRIPWLQIRGLGNRLRHGYETIDSAWFGISSHVISVRCVRRWWP